MSYTNDRDLTLFKRLTPAEQKAETIALIEGEEVMILSLEGHGLVKDGKVYVYGKPHELTDDLIDEILNQLVKGL